MYKKILPTNSKESLLISPRSCVMLIAQSTGLEAIQKGLHKPSSETLTKPQM